MGSITAVIELSKGLVLKFHMTDDMTQRFSSLSSIPFSNLKGVDERDERRSVICRKNMSDSNTKFERAHIVGRVDEELVNNLI